ncbi:MAG: hypothetical protein VZR06_07835, partial [Butyrivibrio sp.]|nr:hypothetical protein [Butyrivibrio sp.]
MDEVFSALLSAIGVLLGTAHSPALQNDNLLFLKGRDIGGQQYILEHEVQECINQANLNRL